MAASQISSRHLLAADGLQSAGAVKSLNIRVLVGEEWANSVSGQLLVSCLSNLLVRQVGLVSSIEIRSPTAPSHIWLPYPTNSTSFPDSLLPMSNWTVNGEVSLRLTPSGQDVDYTLYIGSPAADEDHANANTLHILGDGWRAWVGEPGNAPGGVTPVSRCPLGPFLAAALTAGEIFKRSRGLLRGRFLAANGYSLWSGQSSADWQALDPGPETTGITLPAIHIPGAGAVGNALAYVIANLGAKAVYPIFIDDDHYDTTNLNRCLLAGHVDVTRAKVRSLSSILKTTGIDSYPFEGSVSDYVSRERTGLRGDVAKDVASLHFEYIASCVDKGTSRQDVQGLVPQQLFGGSTLGLQAKTNHYNAYPGSACLACFNPREKSGEKIREFEAKLRNMSPDERFPFLQNLSLPAEAINDYLSGAQCGSLGEAALRDFATQEPPQFSVGFVSLGAGLLLASVLLRLTAFRAIAPKRNVMTSLNFLNGGFQDSGYGADPSCELQCQQRHAQIA